MSEAYELSRQIFEDNAAETGDNVTLRNLVLHGYTANDVANVVAMQNALARWQVRNFGVSSDVALALGFYGEIDELLEARSKEDRIDAWCDMAIFCGQLLMNNRMSIAPVFFGHVHFSKDDKIPSLSHLVLKHAQCIRGIENYRWQLFKTIHIVLYRAWESMLHQTDHKVLAYAYMRVGAEVLKRDWRKFPLNGRDQ